MSSRHTTHSSSSAGSDGAPAASPPASTTITSEYRLRRDAEAALQASEDKYRTLFNTIDEGFCIVEIIFDEAGRPADYRFAEINAVFAEQTGLVNAEGKTALELLPTLEYKWIEMYGRVALTGEPTRFVDDSVPMGRCFDVYSCRIGGAGSPLVAIVFRDITALRRRERRSALLEAIADDLATLSTAAEMMETVGARVGEALGLSGCVFADVDDGADSITINYGWTRNDVPSVKRTFLLRDFLNEEFIRAGHAGESFVVCDTSTDSRTNAGNYAALNIGAFATIPFHWNGRWSSYFSANSVAPREWSSDEIELLKEISNRLFARVERSRAEESLRKSQSDLQEANRRKDEFLATLAHELRNPLAPIQNGVELLRLTGSSELTPVVDVIERQTAQLVRLVDDLMEVSRITRGKIELRRDVHDLRVILRSAIETATPAIVASGTSFILQLIDTPAFVSADSVRLVQVFNNLLNNAAKYTDAGGTITMSLEPGEDEFRVRVRDTGTGIPAEMLPRVFELFTQVDRTLGRAQGGLGIGLALVRTLIEQHGGRIEARSDGPDRGSEFIVHLPAAEQTNDSTHAAAASSTTADAANHLRALMSGKVVVIADDNRDAADTMSGLLKHVGAEVHVVYSGVEALEAVRIHSPSLVFLDLGMPGTDGYAVAQQLRADSMASRPRIIALSGWGQEHDIRLAREAGFDHHLVKPADAARLLELMVSI